MNKNIFVSAFQAVPTEGSENYVAFYIIKTLINYGYNVHIYTPIKNQEEIRSHYRNDLPKNLIFLELKDSILLNIFKPNPLKYSQYILRFFRLV